jgi:BirA family transcriptional regulator, biotin operon repressor / biotin---[acetyl-CoA-carboxylase] ligase
VATILRFAELDSTNDEITRQAQENAPHGLWVMADQQNSGRGRRGRNWISTPGNLFCSTLVRAEPNDPAVQQLSFVACVALHEVLTTYGPEIKLKWPNDLLIDGKKVSGILLETANNLTTIIIGFGVNLQHSPAETERPATSLAAHVADKPPGAQAVLEQLTSAFSQWCSCWRTDGFSPVRAYWLAHAAGLDQRIEVHLGAETLFGTFKALDDSGALMLLLDSGTVRAVHAGEVFGV